MPTYDYVCGECDHAVDIIHSMDDKPPKKCPECGKRKLVRAYRQIAAFPTQLSPMHPRQGRGAGNTGKRKEGL